MNINQQFTVEISRLTADGETVIAPNLGKAITSWVRDFNEEEEEDENHGFLLPEDEDEDGDVTEGEDEEEVEEDEGPNSTLTVTSTVNKAVLAELKALQDSAYSEENLMVRVIYGNDEVGKLVREFEVSPDLFIGLSSGDKEETDLMVTIEFDVYTAALTF